MIRQFLATLTVAAVALVASPAALGATASLPDFTPLIKQEGPAVVNIVVHMKSGNAQVPEDLQDFFRRFMPDQPPPGPTEGLGSGFIISSDGYILTNAHVVTNATDVTVRLADSKHEYKARVIGADQRSDVALIKIDAKNLPTVKLGDSSKVEPGQWVAAIGAPFGFANTITAGIVSAIRRTIPGEAYVPFIQTDVAVNPGNSGGPLINMAGEVIGINSMIYSGTGGYMGVSFAIPIEIALEVGKQLKTAGHVTRGRIGVTVQPVSAELAKAFGLKEAQGALVASVEPGGPADKAGIKSGDVVLAFNGQPIENMDDLPRLVASTKPGTAANIEIWRQGRKENLKVTTGVLPSEKQVAQAQSQQQAPAQQRSRIGVTVSPLPPEGRKELGVDYGLIVQGVQKPGLPLQPGDVIVGVNREKFHSVQEFNKLLSEHKGDTVALLVRRGDASLYVPVPVG